MESERDHLLVPKSSVVGRLLTMSTGRVVPCAEATGRFSDDLVPLPRLGWHRPVELKPVEWCVRAVELGQRCYVGAVRGDQVPIRERSAGACVGDDDAPIRQP